MSDQQPPSKNILYIYPLIGLGVGFVLLMITILMGGGGHDFVGPLFFAFPFATIAAHISDELFFFLALVQYPAYLFFVARDKIKRGNSKPIPIILVFHVLAVILTFMLITR
ncbi:hypothetical protein N9355_06600 [Crocinitomicaceae bacterium]|nr:hypothetical protein [Crocinitomicaceae bacterium]